MKRSELPPATPFASARSPLSTAASPWTAITTVEFPVAFDFKIETSFPMTLIPP
jgi:hypothetical protein